MGEGTVDIGADEFYNPCDGNFDSDGDIDGLNLAAMALDYGRNNCVAPYPRCHGDFDALGEVVETDREVCAALFGKNTCTSGQSRPPVISNLALSEPTLPVPSVGEQYGVSMTFDYDDIKKVDFTISNPYILNEHYSGPTRTAAPSSSDQPSSEESPGFGILAALAGTALVIIWRWRRI